MRALSLFVSSALFVPAAAFAQYARQPMPQTYGPGAGWGWGWFWLVVGIIVVLALIGWGASTRAGRRPPPTRV